MIGFGKTNEKATNNYDNLLEKNFKCQIYSIQLTWIKKLFCNQLCLILDHIILCILRYAMHLNCFVIIILSASNKYNCHSYNRYQYLLDRCIVRYNKMCTFQDVSEWIVLRFE